VAERAGIGDSRIQQVDKSRDTRAVNAFVNGWMGTRQIVLWDTLIERLDEDEVVAIVGHEIGHYRLDHVFRGIVVAALLMMAGLYGVQRAGQAVIHRLGPKLGIERLSDVAALPLLVGLGNVLMLALLPIGYAHSRYMEREADRFGLELTRLNRPAATSFVKLQEANLSNPRPGWLYTIWRATHPSLAERVEFCNQYQPWEEGGVLVYAELLTHGRDRMTRGGGPVSAGVGTVVEEVEGRGGVVAGPLDGLVPAQ
jgi:Zn-dependent protease with chaperone function